MTNFYGQYVGFGSSTPSGPSFRNMGTNYGYLCGGYPNKEHIGKSSFSSDGDQTDAGDLVGNHSGGGGSSDGTYGWVAGGSPTPYTDTVQKFTFATDSDATDILNLHTAVAVTMGINNADYGYTCGGLPTTGPVYNIIQRSAFATTDTAVDVGDLTQGTRGACGMSGATHGYIAGGENDGPTVQHTDVINKISFATATEDAVDHGDLYVTRKACAGNTSADYGFVSAGYGASSTINGIDRFALESNTTATDWADMANSQYVVTGCPSTTHGYQFGGGYPLVDYVEKFPYASQTNATDIGNLQHGASFEGTGVQY